MTKKTAPALLILLLATTLIANDIPQRELRRVEPRDLTAAEIGARPRNGRNLFLRTAVFDPATERPDYQAVGLAKAPAIGEYAVVQFRTADPAAKAALERAGVKFFGYLPDNAYQVRIPRAMRQTVAANAAVRWVGEYESGFKVHPRLWPSAKEKHTAIRVVPFADASPTKLIALLDRQFPGMVVEAKFEGAAYAHVFEVRVPAGKEDDFVRAASALEGVQWIEPNDPVRFHNSASSMAIQNNGTTAADRTIFAHNITGTGQIIAVADSGLDDEMCFFKTLNGVTAVTDAAEAFTDQPGPLSPNNKVIGYWLQEHAAAYDHGPADYHGTHTSGTVAGDNSAHPSSPTDAGLDPGDGMAPNAQILFQDVADAAGQFVVSDPYAMMLQALRGGARVHSDSYGRTSHGNYTFYEQLIDQFMWDHDEMAIFYSAGNDGGPGLTSTIGSPSSAKNIVSVGATLSGTSTGVAIFSSRGPAADGRVKPDIVGPGVAIVSASGDENRTNGQCLTTGKQGTSMSAPTVAGGAALLRQYFADGYYPTGVKNAADTVNASATLVKAVLLNGALETASGSTYGTADFFGKYGWGKILLDSNLYFPGDSRRLRVWDMPNSQGLATGDSRTFTVSAAAGQEFRVTLVWTDPEGALGAAKALVNDLDLTVTKGGDTFLGNVYNNGDSVTGGSADRVNNVEMVRFTAPSGGTYTITVRANSVPGNGRSGTDRQGFALVASGATCSSSVSAAPANLQVKTNAVRGNDLTWTNASGSTITQIYRASGANPAPGDFRYIASSNGTSFTDLRAQGGFTYTYRIRGADDCGEGPASNTVTFTSSGLCDLAPKFKGIESAQADGTNCQINLSWSAGTASCPLSPSVRYNIYRSTTFDFVPSGAPYATTAETSFQDKNVVSGTTYFYVVRAEDVTTASSGPHGGNQESNSARLFATAFGPPGATGTWQDGAGDGAAYANADLPWQINSQYAHTGAHSYHHGPDFTPYDALVCASLVTPSITLDANAELSYWARYNLEYQWDGVIVEISTDNGATWTDLPPQGGYPNTLAQTQGTSGTSTPANACGYPKTKGAFTGPFDNPGLTDWTQYKSSLASFAGQSVKIRWRFTSDPATENEGFFLDDIAVSNAKLPGQCTPVAQAPAAAFNFSVADRLVNFVDQSANGPTSWLWSFGDGGTSTQQNPSHTYAAAGNYTVTLAATNAQGTTTVSKIVAIVAQKPDAAFSVSPGIGTKGVPMTFHDTSLFSPTSWLWNFGDGGTSTQRNPTHTYAAAGNYTVTLTAVNQYGTASISKTVTVREPGSGPSKRRSAKH